MTQIGKILYAEFADHQFRWSGNKLRSDSGRVTWLDRKTFPHLLQRSFSEKTYQFFIIIFPCLPIMPSQQPGLFPAEATLPSLEQVSSDLSKKGNLIPVYQSISSDLITPMSAYLRLSAADPSEPSFLFESVLAGERIGRYSFLGSSNKLQSNMPQTFL